MKVRRLISGVVFFVALFLIVPKASAELLLFSFNDGESNFSFKLDRNPTVNAVDDDQFFISSVPNTSAANPFDVYFFTTFLDGGITFALGDVVLSDNLGYFNFTSVQLFTGPTSSPSFVTGSYDLVGFDIPGGSVPSATLLISVAAVPEASTWAMMILGFSGVGLIMYRRRRTAALAA